MTFVEHIVAIVPAKTTTPRPVAGYPKFSNDQGLEEIIIGVRQFECIGSSPPHDHPHIYLDMGKGDMILCPYCVTRFQLNARVPVLAEARQLRTGFRDTYIINNAFSEVADAFNAAVSEGWHITSDIEAPQIPQSAFEWT